MGVTPAELQANNGKLVAIIDCTGQIYEGILNYVPLDGEFSIKILSDSCCFMTIISPDDVEKLIPIPCIIQQPCCPSKCLPGTMLMEISSANAFCSCLVNEAYVLEWNVPRQRYEFDYPGICDCAILHAYLACVDDKWVFYIALKNQIGLTCVDGSSLNFPLDCATMRGTAAVAFTQTGTCACGPCANDIITVAFSPLL